MKTCIPDCFDRFVCLSGSCPDTCCGQWEIVIDADTGARYQALEGELGQRLREAMTEADGEWQMALRNGRCPMLAEDGLCDIISQLGEEALCSGCHTHPRFTEIYGGLQETVFSVSCPAAAKLLLEREAPLTFRTAQDDTPPEPNDLDGDLFFAMLQSRNTAFSILQNRSLGLSDRLALLLDFANRVDRAVEAQQWRRIHRLSDLYAAEAYLDGRLARMAQLRRHGTMTRIRQLLRAMEHLTEAFPAASQELERTEPDRYATAAEQLAVYFVFRWWLKAACDGYLWRQAAAAAVSVLTVCALAKELGDFTEAARLYSKEVEHADANLSLLRRAMDLPAFSRRELLKLLEVRHAV